MIPIHKKLKIFSGNSSIPLAQNISKHLEIPLGVSQAFRFSDGEISINIDETVRGADVFIIQSTSQPVNDNIMELLIMIDAFKRASAGRITAVMPYFGYGRQDRKAKSRDPISAKLVADLIATAGANRVLTMDLHAPQIQGFFNIPLDHMIGSPIFAKYYRNKFENKLEDLIVVSPDLGSVSRARNFATRLDVPLAIVDKRRPRANVSEVMNIIGDIEGKDVIITDDMIDTAGTFVGAAIALKDRGARNIYACITHGVLSGQAIERINNSPIKELVILDTICIPQEKQVEKVKILSVAPVFAEAMRCICDDSSISNLFI